MKRVIILGPGNSGKSTLANKLGDKLQLPVYHLDKYFWEADWHKVPFERQRQIHQELVNKDKWIIDGNFSKHLPERFERADTVVYLDFPRHVIIPRWFKRMKKYKGTTRPDMADDNEEQFNWLYLSWLLRSKKTQRKVISLAPARTNVVILKNSHEVEKYLSQF